MDSPRQRIFNIPPVVLAVIALLCAVHAVFFLVLTRSQMNQVLLMFAFIPVRYDLGLMHHLNWLTGWGAAIWSFISYACLHADLNHLILNMVWLLAFGTPVARRFGARRFVAFLLVTAAAGAAAHLATHRGEMLPMIGASAAISGAMAAAMRFAFQRGGPIGLLRGQDPDAYHVPAAPLTTMLREPRILVFLLVWFGVNALSGLGSLSLPGMEQSVAWQAHVGGFVAGLLLFALFDPLHPRPATEPETAPDPEASLP